MERFAGALHHLGVMKGDRVTVFAHNGMDYLMAMFACWRIGAIVALVNVRFADELDYYFNDHQPSVVIYTHDQVEPVKRAPRPGAPLGSPSRSHGRPAGGRGEPPGVARRAISCAGRSGRRKRDRLHPSYTSGTTGKPKGACLMHEPTMRATNCIAERLRITSDDISVWADRAVELLSARRQSLAAIASRRDRQRHGPLDAGDRLGRAWKATGSDHVRRQSDACSARCSSRAARAAGSQASCGSACPAAARCRRRSSRRGATS